MPQRKRKGSAEAEETSQRPSKVHFRAATPSEVPAEESDVRAEDDPGEDEWLQGADIRTLCINCHKQTLAVAYHDNSTQTLFMLEDTQDSPAFDLIMALLEQLNPCLILVNAGAHEVLLDTLIDYADEHDDIKVQICTSKDFYINSSLNRWAGVHILRTTSASKNGDMANYINEDSSIAGTASPEPVYYQDPSSHFNTDPQGEMGCKEILIRLGCFTSLEAYLALGAGGALLIHLERVKASQDDHGPIVFRNVQALGTQLNMQINADALSSLSILQSNTEAGKKFAKQEEDLSLYSILNRCQTGLGAQTLKRWMMRPLMSLPHLSARHQAVEVLARPENRQILKTIRDHMKAVKNIHYIFNKLKSGDLEDWVCWKNLADLLQGTLSIVESITNLRGWESVEICRNIQSVCNRRRLRDLLSFITEQVDIDTSCNERRIVACQGYDELLDELNGRLEHLAPILNGVAESIKTEIPPQFSTDIKVVMFPQLGYLVEIQMHSDDADEVPFQYQFCNATSCFFKSAKMQELDQTCGDIYNDVNDRTIELVEVVIEEVSKNAPLLLEGAELLSELDCLISFAEVVVDFQLVRPKMLQDAGIEIHEGRHILYEMVTDNYVSNDTALKVQVDGIETSSKADEVRSSSIMMITGANGSGKSAYAKQVALVVYMAQIGCFVPAQSAQLGIVDKIYTRLQTRESTLKVKDDHLVPTESPLTVKVSFQSGSAFMIDLSQVSLALRGATARSLLVIDEFGKGTNPQDGAGLLAGLTQTLLKRGLDCPKTIIVTHFHDLQEADDPNVVRMHMESVFQEDVEGAGFGDIEFIYRQVPNAVGVTSLRLQPHSSQSSNAAECALQYGLGRDIVERARTITNHLRSFELGKISDIAMSDADRSDLKEAEDLAKLFLKWKPLEDDSAREGEEGDAKAILAKMIDSVGKMSVA